MDIKLIKTRAKQELIKNKEGLIRVVLIDGFILLIPGFFTANDYTTIISCDARIFNSASRSSSQRPEVY